MNDSQAIPDHKDIVQNIAQLVREFAAEAKPGEYFSLKKASVSHMVPQPDNPRFKDKRIDVTKLTNILEINEKAMTCTAESGVTFSQLVTETLIYKLVPKCVSELKTITIGGAVAGCSVESMSYKYGGFYDSCFEFEIVSGTGEIVTCSREKNSDVFEMIHGSFGTMGILTCLKFKLIPAKAYVKMDYLEYPTFDRLMAAIQNHYEHRNVDFMDALVHAKDRCILCVGTFMDTAPYQSKYDLNIFYKSTKIRSTDYLSTYDYFFRYDTECHWCTRNLGLENMLLRLLLGRFVLGSSNILHLAEKFPMFVKRTDPPDVVVDVFIPMQNMAKFWDWYLKTFDYYPLWIVPYQIDKMYPWIKPEYIQNITGKLYVDCAIYAFKQTGKKNYYKLLEDKVYELRGIKTLITHNYYDEATFWGTFNKPMFDRVKDQIDPKNIFRDLYQKTNFKQKKATI